VSPDAGTGQSHIELVNPRSLPDPWSLVVFYWLHHHPERQFLPDLESGEYLLSWDDLRDILAVAGIMPASVSMT
jgi:hypothetical protein